jgi:hypothetical protein
MAYSPKASAASSMNAFASWTYPPNHFEQKILFLKNDSVEAAPLRTAREGIDPLDN